MSRIVVFLDTSVLVEVLGVPGKSQCPAEIQSQLRSRTEAGESMILPTATIIETGNHIAQLGNGDQRRRFAEAFARLLEGTVAGAAPWVLNGARWDSSLLSAICRGARGCPPLADMATRGVGAGDVSILAEAEAYAARVTHVDVRIWTLERLLAAYA